MRYQRLLREALISLEACACKPGKFYRAAKYGLAYRIRVALGLPPRGATGADPAPLPASFRPPAASRPAIRLVPVGERASEGTPWAQLDEDGGE